VRTLSPINYLSSKVISIAEWRTQLRNFLSPLTPEVRHRDVSDALTPGTGKWFLEGEAFQQWLTSEAVKERVLCCVGDPGAGKTGLAYVGFLPLQCHC
jgi:hypothetical protein